MIFEGVGVAINTGPPADAECMVPSSRARTIASSAQQSRSALPQAAGIFSDCPGMMWSGSFRMSRLALKITGYFFASP